MSDNLKLWNSVQETDPKYTKKVTYGNKFTSINATYQVKTATEQWGLYGDTWGIESVNYTFHDLDKGQIMVLAKAIFKYPIIGEGTASFPISSTIMMQEYSKKYSELQTDDEWAKKIETDITTKALSKLGFNADVFMGMYDDNKYINRLTEKYKEPKELPTITDANFDKYLEKILAGGKDNNGVVITEAYLKARHALSDKQQQELANV